MLNARSLSSLALIATVLATADRAHAEPDFDDDLVLATGRIAPATPLPDRFLAQVHGEYQFRLLHMTDLPLPAPSSDHSATSLGRGTVATHWLRLSPRVDIHDKVAIVGQLDIPRGMVFGDETRQVGTASDPMDRHQPFHVDLRWLYAEATTPIGLFRVGQQGSHWGTGILGNDGNHPRLFGDYTRGSIAERVLFATRPLGKDSPLALLAAGDLIFRDQQANLINGDRAWQGTLAALLGKGPNEIGIYAGWRRQRRTDQAVDEFTPYTQRLNVLVLDAFARFAARIPGGGGWVFGEGEAALLTGATNYVRTPEAEARRQDEKIRAWGGQFTLGAAHTAKDGNLQWGDVVASLEWGFATGDADPNDGVQRRFTFEPNHKVGLVMFDQAMAWTTARSAVNATDPGLVNRGNPGLQFYPSNGGVFGASYLYPTIVVRPKHWIDLKGAMLVAQSTADVVDPYQFGVEGKIANAGGATAKRHDLGLELDGGFEVRVDLNEQLRLQLGGQAGVLFPGHAFDATVATPAGAKTVAMAAQTVAVGRVGLQF